MLFSSSCSFHSGTQNAAFIIPKINCFFLQVSLLLGTIIRKIPLPTSSLTPLENGDLASAVSNASVIRNSGSLLDLKQLEKIGDHFLEVLLKMKHNGAIDKTRAGFSALCHRLLCSNDPRYDFKLLACPCNLFFNSLIKCLFILFIDFVS